MDDLNCPKCKHPMTPCYNGGGFLRVWWCQLCDYTDKAIGRERLLRPEALDAGHTTEAELNKQSPPQGL